MEAWLVTVIVFGLTQLGSLIWLLATMRGDARVTQTQLTGMQKEIETQGKVLERQAKLMEEVSDQRSDIALIQERQLSQSKRMDEFDRRLNNIMERYLLHRREVSDGD